MSLLDEAKALMRPVGPICSIARLKAEHPDKAAQIDELIEGVRSKAVAGSKAGLVLKGAFDLPGNIGDTVRRHANRSCACPS